MGCKGAISPWKKFTILSEITMVVVGINPVHAPLRPVPSPALGTETYIFLRMCPLITILWGPKCGQTSTKLTVDAPYGPKARLLMSIEPWIWFWVQVHTCIWSNRLSGVEFVSNSNLLFIVLVLWLALAPPSNSKEVIVLVLANIFSASSLGLLSIGKIIFVLVT